MQLKKNTDDLCGSLVWVAQPRFLPTNALVFARTAYCLMEAELQDLLAGLGLARYEPVFEEEAITELALLKSIGSAGFVEAMAELNLDAYAAEALRAELFPAQPTPAIESDDDELALEDNEEGARDEDEGLMLEENEPQALAPAQQTPKAPPAAGPVDMSLPPTSSGATSGVGGVEQAVRYKDEGNVAQQAGKHADAAALYSKAIGCDPREAAYFSNRSAAYAALRRFSDALADADEAVRLKPDWAKTQMRRGAALMGLGRPAEARKAFERASAIEPRNAQLRAMAEEAAEAVAAEAADMVSTDGGSNWVAILNEEVRHKLYMELATDEEDEAAYDRYASELDSALAELKEDGATKLAMRSGARGSAVDAESISGATEDKLFVDCVLRRSGRPLTVRLRHINNRYDWEDEDAPESDELIRDEMRKGCEAERARLERLVGAEGWCQLVKELANETEACVGVGREMVRYPAVFTERLEGRPLHQMLDAEHGCGGEEAEHPPAVDLERDLSLVMAVARACLLAMKGAYAAGLAFEPSGAAGPFPADVRAHPLVGHLDSGRASRREFSVVLCEVEAMEEVEPTRSFSAIPLVHSPLGGYVRRWWAATAPKLDLVGGKADDAAYAEVLSRCGSLDVEYAERIQ